MATTYRCPSKTRWLTLLEYLIFVVLFAEVLTVKGTQVKLTSNRYRSDYKSYGEVQIYHEGSWRYVCGTGWGNNEAIVICRMLGFPFGGSAQNTRNYYGYYYSDRNFLKLSQSCTSTESDISDCPHSVWTIGTCILAYRGSAAVRCNKPVDGNWNRWGRWTQCSVTCGAGLRYSYRQCNNPKPQYGGADCVGTNATTSQCQAGVKCPEVVYPTELEVKGTTESINSASYLDLQLEFDIQGKLNLKLYDKQTYDLRLYMNHGYYRGNRGRIEVYKWFNNTRSGLWGTICDDSFGKAEADVVCRTLGYIFGGIAKIGSYFGVGYGQILIDELQCNGTEDTVASCKHDEWKTHNCDHNEDAGVICYLGYWSDWSHCGTTCGTGTRSRYLICHNQGSDDCTRLLDSDKCQLSPCAVDGVWSAWESWTICSVTCENGTRTRYRKCDNPTPIHGGKECYGNNTQYRPCEMGFNCPVEVRLAGSNTDNQGRVEVYYNRTWGTICNDGWDNDDASVICKMLNYSYGGTTLPSSSFAEGHGVIWMDNVECNSHEINISDCHHNNWGVHNCKHHEDAGALCFHNEFEDNVTLRLIGSDHPDRGRVEVYFMDEWGTICDNNWDDTDATVICKMLGFHNGGITYENAKFGTSTGKVWLDYVECKDGDETIIECQHSNWGSTSCSHDRDASVLCLPPETMLKQTHVRLVGGDHSDRGRVEVLVAGEWGMVCSKDWNTADAQLICGILGQTYNGILINGSVFGDVSGRMWKSNISCQENNSSSPSCSINIFGNALICSKNHILGVWCTDTANISQKFVINLVGGDKPDRGRIEIFFMDKWGTVCGLDETTAGFICGMEEAMVVQGNIFGQGNGTAWLSNVSCNANESSILDCKHNGWGNSNCSNEQESGVWCISKLEAERDIQLRLVGSKYLDRGRLEIEFMDKWGTICNNGWDDEDADVFCRYLGYHNGGIAVSNVEYGRGEGIIWLNQVECNSTSVNITDCQHSQWGKNTCDHSQDAAVICISGEGKVCSVWGNWSKCSVTCGNGTATRSRKCKIPGTEGDEFDEDIVDVAECFTWLPCPIDGEWGNWSQWTSCSSTCESGMRTRHRKCNNPVTQFGGHWCIGNKDEAEECITGVKCPINGNWTEWNVWTPCSVTCENGTRTRVRYCHNPKPSFGGKNCVGSSTEEESCNANDYCPINGQWSTWTEWTSCSATCEKGIRRRSRECDNPGASFGGRQCVGNDFEVVECMTNVKCPIHGIWSTWGPWTDCTTTCGNGTMYRSRFCNNPMPYFGGNNCEGDDQQIKACATDVYCPVDGDWGLWSPWSECSVTCDSGTVYRNRSCNYPVPLRGGRQCNGSDVEFNTCLMNNSCPVNGGWGYWSSWSACPVTCGTGAIYRNRSCDDPVTLNGGQQCTGSDVEFSQCLTNISCPVDGQWSIWSRWSVCSVTCECGTMQRRRDCNNPPPSSDGQSCNGTGSEEMECLIGVPCKDDCDAGKFVCQDNKTCITTDMSCDGFENCPDGEDEINCLGLFFTP